MPRIAIVEDPRGGWTRGIILGMADFGAAMQTWEMRLFSPSIGNLERIGSWRPEAIVHGFLPSAESETLVSLEIPLIGTSLPDPQQRFPSVCLDHPEIGRLAGEYFLSRGFRQIFFLHEPREYWWATVQNGLHQICHSRGAQSQTVAISPAQGLSREEALQIWIDNLHVPLPIAVCANSEMCVALAQVCRNRKHPVPDEIAILAAEDHDTDCRLCFPPLSAIQLAGEDAGRRCGQLLQQIFTGNHLAPTTQFMPPLGITERASTKTLAISDSIVALAVERIQNDLSSRPNIADILSGLDISRRSLELRFHAAMGCSPLQVLGRIRLSRMKQVLGERHLNMEEIAKRFGFDDVTAFYRDFRRHAGITPMQYVAQFETILEGPEKSGVS